MAVYVVGILADNRITRITVTFASFRHQTQTVQTGLASIRCVTDEETVTWNINIKKIIRNIEPRSLQYPK